MGRDWRPKIRLSQGIERTKYLESFCTLSNGGEMEGFAIWSHIGTRPCVFPAGSALPGVPGVHQIGTFRLAAAEDIRAAGMERAARRNFLQPGHGPANMRELIFFLSDLGNGIHETHGVGVLGSFHQV